MSKIYIFKATRTAINTYSVYWEWSLNFFHIVSEKIIAAARDVQEKNEIYAPYNILPLDSAGASQSAMQLEEVSII